MMSAVATMGFALGLALGIEALLRQSRTYHERAAFHAQCADDIGRAALRKLTEAMAKRSEDQRARDAAGLDDENWLTPELITLSAQRESQLALARKYQRASRYPWLSVAPDPPEPE
jgi:hypothetical protein